MSFPAGNDILGSDRRQGMTRTQSNRPLRLMTAATLARSRAVAPALKWTVSRISIGLRPE